MFQANRDLSILILRGRFGVEDLNKWMGLQNKTVCSLIPSSSPRRVSDEPARQFSFKKLFTQMPSAKLNPTPPLRDMRSKAPETQSLRRPDTTSPGSRLSGWSRTYLGPRPSSKPHRSSPV